MTTVAAPFDLQGMIARSKPLDLSDIDWSRASQEPLNAAELRILPYFIDVESYTINYLKALLNTSASQDAEICDFLSIWAYEESYHGRALERVLAEAGHPLDPKRPKSVERPPRFRETLQDFTATCVSKLVGPDFVAVHMTWGAIQELSTLNGYRCLANRTKNSVLAEVIRRIMRDEARHFAFYYHKAEEKLTASPFARKLVPFLVRRFWRPVGAGIMPDQHLDFLFAYMFAGEEGLAEMRHVDETIARLPGMEWFRGLEAFTQGSQARMAAAGLSV